MSKQISGQPPHSGSPSDGAVLPIQEAGATKKITIGQLKEVFGSIKSFILTLQGSSVLSANSAVQRHFPLPEGLDGNFYFVRVDEEIPRSGCSFAFFVSGDEILITLDNQTDQEWECSGNFHVLAFSFANAQQLSETV